MWIIITVLLFGTVVDLNAQRLLSDTDRELMSQAVNQIEKKDFLDSFINSSFCSVQLPESTTIFSLNFQFDDDSLNCQEKITRLSNYYDIFLDIDAPYFEKCLNKLKNASMTEHRMVLNQLLKSGNYDSYEADYKELIKENAGLKNFKELMMCNEEGPLDAMDLIPKVNFAIRYMLEQQKSAEKIPMIKEKEAASSVPVDGYSQTMRRPEENKKIERNASSKSTSVVLKQEETVKFFYWTRKIIINKQQQRN